MKTETKTTQPNSACICISMDAINKSSSLVPNLRDRTDSFSSNTSSKITSFEGLNVSLSGHMIRFNTEEGRDKSGNSTRNIEVIEVC